MSEARDNFFLVVEGLDGSGKTEVVRRLSQILRQGHKDDVMLTFEPHDPSCAGLYIRQVLTKKIPLNETTLALAYAVNRADHNDREIIPFLNRGKQRIVLCDRYYLSSLVYQATPELPLEDIMLINKGAQRPDLTIFLDASVETCHRRMKIRPESKELFEKNLKVTKDKYTTAIAYLRQRGDSIVEVDANPDIADVIKSILNVLSINGPGWLRLKQPLMFTDDVFTMNGEIAGEEGQKLEQTLEKFTSAWNTEPIVGEDSLQERLKSLNQGISDEVEAMSLNDLGLLLIGYLKREGYQLGSNLPWTDLSAYELDFSMPLNVLQKGTLVILDEAQGYDKIRQKVQEIMQLSNFMIILDPKRYPDWKGYYEQSLVQYSQDSHNRHAWIDNLRDLVEKDKTFSKKINMRLIEDKLYESLSPSTYVITRADIKKYLLTDSLKQLYEQQLQTFHEFPNLTEALRDFATMQHLSLSL